MPRNSSSYTINLSIKNSGIKHLKKLLEKNSYRILAVLLTVISIAAFLYYHQNGLGLAYNDARSHLDIGRRVVEGLKPGLAQLGSVWLPLPHILMIPFIWNDFMWHSGLAGAIVSMISFIATGLLVYTFLKELGVGLLGRLVGVFVFAANINILYLQSTAMTELLLLATMTFASYEIMMWHKNSDIFHLIKSAFWIMLSTLTRYDGWFLLAWVSVLIVLSIYRKRGYKPTEGIAVLFGTLSGFGILLWLAWNLVIFKDPLYFAFGPFSAKAQQDQLEAAGVLQTKYSLWLSFKFYLYALVYNSGAFTVILGTIGAFVLWLDKSLSKEVRIATTALIAPLAFNVLALYLGHSVLFIDGLSGTSWFNVRYGIMLAPSIAIFIGYLIHKLHDLRWTMIGLLLFVTFFTFTSADAVTIDDATVGSSQKNVEEVSGWLAENAANEEGFILISAASHDAIIFSSGLPMKRFIHEGTGLYWENAVTYPDRWARWIIMRTHDENDLTFKMLSESGGMQGFEHVGHVPFETDEDRLRHYSLVDHFPFADIYEIRPEYIDRLNTEPIFDKQ
jgi:hypothetical protein